MTCRADTFELKKKKHSLRTFDKEQFQIRTKNSEMQETGHNIQLAHLKDIWSIN